MVSIYRLMEIARCTGAKAGTKEENEVVKNVLIALDFANDKAIREALEKLFIADNEVEIKERYQKLRDIMIAKMHKQIK